MAYMPKENCNMYLDDSKMTKIYDLSMPWGIDTPLWPFPGARQDLIFPRGQYLGRFHKRTNTYTGTLHAGTHMDAPVHVLQEEEVDREKNGYFLNEIPLARCIGSGIIVDMRYLRDEFEAKFQAAGGDPAKMDASIWHIITPKEFDAACAKDGLEVRENDWVIINTGFHHYWQVNNDKYYNYYPGEGPELANYLTEVKHIKGISGTWGATDAPCGTTPWPSRCPGWRRITSRPPDTASPRSTPTMSPATASTCSTACAPWRMPEATSTRSPAAAWSSRPSPSAVRWRTAALSVW